LRHKLLFLLLPTFVFILGAAVWLGFDTVLEPASKAAEKSGIASDDGVAISTYLDQSFRDRKTTTILIPILTSTRRGSDVMQPMAIPPSAVWSLRS
jgi:hypothetical protein